MGVGASGDAGIAGVGRGGIATGGVAGGWAGLAAAGGAVVRSCAGLGIPGLTMAGWARADLSAPTSGTAWGRAGTDRGPGSVAAARSGVAGFGGAAFAIVGFGLAGFGVAGSGAASGAGVGAVGARIAGGGSVTLEARPTWRAAAAPGAAGLEGVAAGAGICTVGFFAAVVVFAGKDALTLLDEASTAVVGWVGMLWGTEPSASGAGVCRVPRGRPEVGGGLPALGGFAILGFTPLFRHINEIRDRGAILPTA